MTIAVTACVFALLGAFVIAVALLIDDWRRERAEQEWRERYVREQGKRGRC